MLAPGRRLRALVLCVLTFLLSGGPGALAAGEERGGDERYDQRQREQQRPCSSQAFHQSQPRRLKPQ